MGRIRLYLKKRPSHCAGVLTLQLATRSLSTDLVTTWHRGQGCTILSMVSKAVRVAQWQSVYYTWYSFEAVSIFDRVLYLIGY